MDKAEIYMFPANSKTMIKYEGKVSVLRILKWIEKNAENRLLLPDLPHIDLELQDEYYTKKATLESYEENLNKDDLEVDDLINMDFQKVVVASETTREKNQKYEF
jgi:hypothetical protein